MATSLLEPLLNGPEWNIRPIGHVLQASSVRSCSFASMGSTRALRTKDNESLVLRSCHHWSDRSRCFRPLGSSRRPGRQSTEHIADGHGFVIFSCSAQDQMDPENYWVVDER